MESLRIEDQMKDLRNEFQRFSNKQLQMMEHQTQLLAHIGGLIDSQKNQNLTRSTTLSQAESQIPNHAALLKRVEQLQLQVTALQEQLEPPKLNFVPPLNPLDSLPKQPKLREPATDAASTACQASSNLNSDSSTEFSVGLGEPKEMSEKRLPRLAKRPKVSKSSKSIEISVRNYMTSVTSTFDFEPEKFTSTVNVCVLATNECLGQSNYRLDLLEATIQFRTNTTNSCTCDLNRHDYFIHLEFMKCSGGISSGSGIHKWIQLSTRCQKCDSNNYVSLKARGNLLPVTLLELTEARAVIDNMYSLDRGYSCKIKVLATVIVKHYDELDVCSMSPLPSNSQERFAKLLNLKDNLHSEIIFKAGVGLISSIAVNEIILRDFCPAFDSIFGSLTKADAKVKEIVLPYVSGEGIILFYNWIYGLDSGVWLNNVELNLELLAFADNYMILELIQICTDNLIKTPDAMYTLPLVIKTGKYGEINGIPGLEDRAFDWIKRKSGLCLDGCMPWKE